MRYISETKQFFIGVVFILAVFLALWIISILLQSCSPTTPFTSSFPSLKPYEWVSWKKDIEAHGFYVVCLHMDNSYTFLDYVPPDVTECDVALKSWGPPQFGELVFLQETTASKYRKQVFSYCGQPVSKRLFDFLVQNWRKNNYKQELSKLCPHGTSQN